jgi:uncharacterized membrane protein YuzA (DUF378 family)
MPTMLTNTNHPAGGSSAITKTIVMVAIIGALNWGLVGFFQFNLVDAIFGGIAPEQPSVASRVVYMIVGLCGLASVFLLPKLHFEVRHPSDIADRAP